MPSQNKKIRPATKGSIREIGGAARRAFIKELIQSGKIHSHAQLEELLKTEGINVTQATISRDLEAIGAYRSRSENSELIYRLDSNNIAEKSDSAISIKSVKNSANILLITTNPGAASILAAQIDRKIMQNHLRHCLGTLAGDDTVMILMEENSINKAVYELSEVYPEIIQIYKVNDQSKKVRGRK